MLASVIEGEVDQYVLDGKDISVKIPAVLLERMERLSHQVSQKCTISALTFRMHSLATLMFSSNLQLFWEPLPTVASEAAQLSLGLTASNSDI